MEKSYYVFCNIMIIIIRCVVEYIVYYIYRQYWMEQLIKSAVIC